jgi:hypothetical protein
MLSFLVVNASLVLSLSHALSVRFSVSAHLSCLVYVAKENAHMVG